MFLYYRDDGTVCMRSNEKIKTSLRSVEINPSVLELEKIQNNYEQWIIDDKLVFKTPKHLEEQIKKRDIEKIKEDLDNGATTKSILQRLLSTL